MNLPTRAPPLQIVSRPNTTNGRYLTDFRDLEYIHDSQNQTTPIYIIKYNKLRLSAGGVPGLRSLERECRGVDGVIASPNLRNPLVPLTAPFETRKEMMYWWEHDNNEHGARDRKYLENELHRLSESCDEAGRSPRFDDLRWGINRHTQMLWWNVTHLMGGEEHNVPFNGTDVGFRVFVPDEK